MKKINLFSLIFALIFSLQSCAQESKTYWKIKDIYREDKQEFLGLNGIYMKEILKQNFHFIRENNTLSFDLPSKFELDLKNFKNLNQIKITDQEYYEMYDQKFSGNTFLVKFKDEMTTSDSKNTIIEFEKRSKEDYDKDLAKAAAERKEIAQKMTTLKEELKKNPPIHLEPTKKFPQKEVSILIDKSEKIELLIPDQIELRESGDIKNEKFNDIKIGTFRKDSKIYDIEHSGEDYGLDQLTIWVSTDPANFDIEKYIKDNPNMFLVKQENNNILGYILRYDDENKEAVIQSFFSLKYLKIGKSQIFIYSDVNRSQIKNYPNSEKMNKIINFNYSISENISLVKK
ncbi:hypothetical protein SAMN05660477_00261 [Soonwooa buanensis]|uniref:Lipoprotein n=1 Tax=Soonwooa buanensis TaxID=619805 RepID=A0A1T5CRH6_9FLAO|nr:hypothetical protein [Soonwooa buanensis]SKB61943.1 hypothetical protein SAMN05660477_00261 [Soonwooa buanensis]